MHFNMRENSYAPAPRQRRSVMEPVIDQNRGTIERDSINIQKNCGPDNICIPDLRLSVDSVNDYILGSKDLIVFDVVISNHGEDAFETGFYMTVPPGLNFRKIERIGDVRDTPITCTAPSPATNNSLKCDIGNPLPSGKIAKFKVLLLPAQHRNLAPKYDFYLEANSTNAESEGTRFDNIIKREVGISVETNLAVKGVSIDEEVLYNTTDYVAMVNATREEQIGASVVHIYEIRNGGPSTIEEAEVFITWPFRTLNGDELVYLLNQPETTRNLKCELTQYANERNLQLDRALVARSYLVSQGAIDKSSLHTDGNRFSSSSSSSSSSAGHASGGSGGALSQDEILRIKAEEGRESTGDASYVHRQRANEAAQASSSSSLGSSSWSSSDGSQPAITYSASRNRSTYRDQDGQLHVSEHSTEHYGGASAGQSRVQQAGFVRQLEDFPSEGHVNQDISSSVQSQSSGTTGRRRMMSQQDGEEARPGLITGAKQFDYGSNEFRAGVLDVGNGVSRNNVDDEIHRYGSSSRSGSGGGSSSGSGSYGSGSRSSQSSHSSQAASSGNRESSSSSSRSSYGQSSGSSGYGSASRTSGSSGYTSDGHHQGFTAPTQYPGYHATVDEDANGDYNDDYYDAPPDNQLHSAPSQNQPRYHPANQGFQHYHRIRRQAAEPSNVQLNELLSCKNTQCATIRCVTTRLETDGSAWIALRMRLVTETMNLVSFYPNFGENSKLNIFLFLLS